VLLFFFFFFPFCVPAHFSFPFALQPRQGILDFIHRYPLLKMLLARLPNWTWQRFRHAGMVLALTEQGHVAHFLADMDGDVAQKVTTARRVGDRLVLGFIEGGVIASMSFPRGAQSGSDTVPRGEQTFLQA